MKDMKEALTSGRKPDISHVRGPGKVYSCRAHEYGSDKYERANYVRLSANAADAARNYRSYLASVDRHITAALDAMEYLEAEFPGFEDAPLSRLLEAVYAADTDASPSFPASTLPHISHAMAGLGMAITKAVRDGILPADPGQPWKDSK